MLSAMSDPDLSPDVRVLEQAKISSEPGRPRGNAAWARAQIQAGAQVRKVIWPPGPFVAAGSAPSGVRFTMSEPWSALLLDDVRMIHETTPIQPAGELGWRDTLVLTFRLDGFQDP